MFSRRVPENREASWKTTPMRERSSSSGSSVLVRPTTSTAPARGSYRPSSRFTIVDFPPPDSPTSAIFSPRATEKSIPCSTSSPSS